jgi:hypothetical protein
LLTVQKEYSMLTKYTSHVTQHSVNWAYDWELNH